MTMELSRRQMIVRSGVSLGAIAAAACDVPAAPASLTGPAARSARPFGYSLNTCTIRGQKLSVPEQVEVTAKAGYDGIEPWLGELHQYAEKGGSLGDLRKRIADLGLSVVGAIGFAAWIAEDDAVRAKGVEQMKRDMDLVARIGGRWIAAPPAGGYDKPVDLRRAAQRYRALLEMGAKIGVTPQLELWGGSKTISRIGEAAFVAAEAGRPDAGLLLDAYHIYKGGSDFSGLRLLNGAAMHDFHINDYPADPPREKITDADRVYPGDGIAPLESILRTLHAAGYRGFLSLEVFNRGYWEQDALAVARTGLEKIRRVVQKSLG
jgi:2-keto-myo-inositol isomerase